MSKKLELFIKSVLVASFFVPLIAIPDNYIFPFIVPKIVVFRSLVLMMLGAYILLLFTNWQKYRIKLTAINIGVLVFLFSFTISTIVGVDFYKSFWDCHERMLGLFTIFHYIAYYFIITSVITKWEDWKWIFRIFLGAGFIVMFIGMIQKINPEYLVISAPKEKDSPHDHPHRDALALYKKYVKAKNIFHLGGEGKSKIIDIDSSGNISIMEDSDLDSETKINSRVLYSTQGASFKTQPYCPYVD